MQSTSQFKQILNCVLVIWSSNYAEICDGVKRLLKYEYRKSILYF